MSKMCKVSTKNSIFGLFFARKKRKFTFDREYIYLGRSVYAKDRT